MMKGFYSVRKILCLFLSLVITSALSGPVSTSADRAADGFFLTAEYDRLYFAPFDGSAPRLMVDGSTVCTVRSGRWMYASFEDGSVRRLSLNGSLV